MPVERCRRREIKVDSLYHSLNVNVFVLSYVHSFFQVALVFFLARTGITSTLCPLSTFYYPPLSVHFPYQNSWVAIRRLTSIQHGSTPPT